MSFAPTDEQERAVALALTGNDLAIKALAGTGKTSTLRLIAEAMPERSIQYIAFNKAIVTDATGTFPRNVTCSTAHSLAFQAIARGVYDKRLGGKRMRPTDMATLLDLDPLVIEVDGKAKRLAPAFLAGLVKRAVQRFCQTADTEISSRHTPHVDGIDPAGTFDNQSLVREHVAHAIGRYWADVQKPDGRLPFDHGCYLKLWQLSKPTINSDVILYDEAQDANPCMLSIVAQQAGKAQLIYVGDDYQQIYAWNGAVNALGSVHGDTAYLTQSFRFGDAIAEAANFALGLLDAEVTVRGTPTITSEVTAISEPSVILCRTNAAAVREALSALKDGRRVAMVGGADEIVRFAEAAEDLRDKGSTSHPELACFTSWGEVKDYALNDPNGADLQLLVRLIDDFGAREIIMGLGRTVNEATADLVVSTAHKAKGREWPSVVLAGDFPDPDKRPPSDEELRLLYVAITRAKLILDIRAVKLMAKFLPGAVGGASQGSPETPARDLGSVVQAGQAVRDGSVLATALAEPSRPTEKRRGVVTRHRPSGDYFWCVICKTAVDDHHGHR